MTANKPWYREALVWLLIAPPATAIIAGMVTLYLAVTSNDGLVADDYYQQGKTINRVLKRDQAAAHYGYSSALSLDVANNRVALGLQRADSGALPARVTLRLLHATRGNFDQAIELERGADGLYRASIPDLIAGHWNLQVEADDWRLTGSLRTPNETAATLKPAV